MSENERTNPEELREVYSNIVPSLAPPDVFDPVLEAYKKDVDRSLLRQSLKRTPAQRAERMLGAIRAIKEYRRQRGWK